jgi:hypothetical protein
MKPAFKIIFQIFLVLLFGILGCESDTPNSPTKNLALNRSTNQLHFLKSQSSVFNKVFTTERYVAASEGGTVLVGDETSGYCSIHFMPGDLTDNTLISFEWNSQNFFTELNPHGIYFNNPVRLTLSYNQADVSAVDEENVRIWYYDESQNAWELIGGQVDTENRQVEAYISHFSRYALAEED